MVKYRSYLKTSIGHIELQKFATCYAIIYESPRTTLHPFVWQVLGATYMYNVNPKKLYARLQKALGTH